MSNEWHQLNAHCQRHYWNLNLHILFDNRLPLAFPEVESIKSRISPLADLVL
jgi:hypothetical protein